DRTEAVNPLELILPAGHCLAFTRAKQLGKAVDRIFGDDHEQGRVDGIDTFAQDGPLSATLTSHRRRSLLAGFSEKATGVLEMVALHDAAERLAGRQRLAVARVDVADLALRDGDEWHFVETILPSPKSEVETAAQ